MSQKRHNKHRTLSFKKKVIYGLSCYLSIFLCFYQTITANPTPIFSSQHRFHPVVSHYGMVVSQEALASQVGADILRKGGNAVDAAVAIGFALAVTLPRAGNLGGGGFMMIYHAKTKQVMAIDYREKAPFSAYSDMFLDEHGEADNEKSRHSLLSSGVPGTVAGLSYVLKEYGTLSLNDVILPAIKLAKIGFPITAAFQEDLNHAKKRFSLFPESMRIFYDKTGTVYPLGHMFQQLDLGKSLDLIKKKGPEAFYKGSIAKKIVGYMTENNGAITMKDLAGYRVVNRKPVKGVYRGYNIYAMPPPSSGGIHLIQMLNMLEQFDIKKMGHNTADTIHVMSEIMKLAYADRSKYLGDPDFNKILTNHLISKSYAQALVSKINRVNTTPSTKIHPGNPSDYIDHPETTHFTVMDNEGNVVSNTYTLNFSFGNHHVVPGTGILLNNEMDDFTAKTGAPNAYGLIGGELNSIQPEKRMLSSMTPTIVLKDGQPFLATGSPGGSRIITTVLQLILNVIDHNMNIAEATSAVRIHHQWFPDTLRIERGLNLDTQSLLKTKGHYIHTGRTMGATQSILYQHRLFFGATDPRRNTGAVSGLQSKP